MSRTGVPACRDVRASALAPPLSERQAQRVVDLLQNEGGGASKKTRAARQAGTPVLLKENSGRFFSSEWLNRKRSNGEWYVPSAKLEIGHTEVVSLR